MTEYFRVSIDFSTRALKRFDDMVEEFQFGSQASFLKEALQEYDKLIHLLKAGWTPVYSRGGKVVIIPPELLFRLATDKKLKPKELELLVNPFAQDNSILNSIKMWWQRRRIKKNPFRII